MPSAASSVRPVNTRSPFAQQAELADDNAAVFIHGNAVHAAFLCKEPLAVHLEILGENAHGVVMLRRNAVKRGGHADGIRRVPEALLGKNQAENKV